MTIIDTHIWIWRESAPEKLSDAARELLEYSDLIGICAISCWEVPMLIAKGRLKLDRDVLTWMKQALAKPRTLLLPITPEIGATASKLSSDLPGDPADRLIAATTLEHKAKLVTKDDRLRNSGRIPTVW